MTCQNEHTHVLFERKKAGERERDKKTRLGKKVISLPLQQSESQPSLWERNPIYKKGTAMANDRPECLCCCFVTSLPIDTINLRLPYGSERISPE